MKISLLVPTFNRVDIVGEMLRECINKGFVYRDDLSIVISDNGSTDGTFDHLCEIKSTISGINNVVLLGSDTNQGYANNIKKLLFSASNEYAILTSDEDPPIEAGLNRLLEYLANRDLGFVCTDFYLDASLYRGRQTRSGQYSCAIDGGSIRSASFYSSGLVFNSKYSRSLWIEFEEFIADPDNFYPQVCLAALLTAKHGGEFVPQEVCYKRTQAGEGLHFLGSYDTPKARFNEFLFFSKFFTFCRKNMVNEKAQIFFDEAVSSCAVGALGSFGNYIYADYPDMASAFNAQMVNYAVTLLNNGAVKVN